MTDELTPEEREALKSLPRERMPSADLEGRVVGALRGRGVLSKRKRRTIEITSSRVVGLVAACAALVIGGYSVGLNRGESESLTVTPPARERITATKNEPATAPDEKKAEATEQATDINKAPELREQTETRDNTADRLSGVAGEEKDMPSFQSAAPPPAAPEKEPVAKRSARRELGTLSDDTDPAPASDVAQGRVQADKMASQVVEESVAEVPVAEEPVTLARDSPAAAPAPTAMFKQDTDVAAFAETLTFLLNGTRVVVEIPEGVRIDKQRSDTIVIYTTHGPIRLRVVADD